MRAVLIHNEGGDVCVFGFEMGLEFEAVRQQGTKHQPNLILGNRTVVFRRDIEVRMPGPLRAENLIGDVL